MKNEAGYDCVIQILRTANVLWRESRRFFRPFGITEAQFNIMNLLGQNPKGLSQRELSDHLVVDCSNITLLLDKMEKSKLVTRYPVPGDRRAHRVALTPKGEKLWEEVVPPYQKAIQSIIEKIPGSKLTQASDVLKEVEKQTPKWPELIRSKN